MNAKEAHAEVLKVWEAAYVEIKRQRLNTFDHCAECALITRHKMEERMPSLRFAGSNVASYAMGWIECRQWMDEQKAKNDPITTQQE